MGCIQQYPLKQHQYYQACIKIKGVTHNDVVLVFVITFYPLKTYTQTTL